MPGIGWIISRTAQWQPVRTVYQESNGGKWVRYDENGHMVKGWDVNENGSYYFDQITGAMAKGVLMMDGIRYGFDHLTGALLDRK